MWTSLTIKDVDNKPTAILTVENDHFVKRMRVHFPIVQLSIVNYAGDPSLLGTYFLNFYQNGWHQFYKIYDFFELFETYASFKARNGLIYELQNDIIELKNLGFDVIQRCPAGKDIFGEIKKMPVCVPYDALEKCFKNMSKTYLPDDKKQQIMDKLQTLSKEEITVRHYVCRDHYYRYPKILADMYSILCPYCEKKKNDAKNEELMKDYENKSFYEKCNIIDDLLLQNTDKTK